MRAAMTKGRTPRGVIGQRVGENVPLSLLFDAMGLSNELGAFGNIQLLIAKPRPTYRGAPDR